jgi:3-oxoacyl-[acyl-carrier protein] reductase
MEPALVQLRIPHASYPLANRRESTMTTLRGKTALVTGASRGIGRATAAALAQAGAHLLVHDGRSTQEAESLVSEIQTKGGRADAISVDLGTPDGASLLAKQVRSIVGHRLDVLVLNAGVNKRAPIADYTVEDCDTLFATNVRGPFFLVEQLLAILEKGSDIVVISSLGARVVVGNPGLENPSIFAYASTKRGGRLRLRSKTGPVFSGRAADA